MRFVRHVVVLDAADVETESIFWARMLSGQVVDDDPQFHCVIDADGRWLVDVQRAPNHVPPEWPDGNPQQVHLDLHVDDAENAHAMALSLGARLLQPGDMTMDEGYQVYSDPAGHPFCIGWGQPDEAELRTYLEERT